MLSSVDNGNTTSIIDSNSVSVINLTAHRPWLSLLDHEYLVFGFIANIESKNRFSISIPTEVFQLCWLYYTLADTFVSHGPSMQTLDSYYTIKRIDDGNHKSNTVYGYQTIDPMDKSIKKYKWTLLCNFKCNNHFYFGIDSSNRMHTNHCFKNWKLNKSAWYAFNMRQFLFRHNIQDSCQCAADWDHTLCDGCIIEMEFDVRWGALKCIINGIEHRNMVFAGVDTKDVKYNLAISLRYKCQRVQIIKYETEQ